MTLTLLPAATRTSKPWKNGGGITTDVWTTPEGAGLENFIARVSIAEVASDGPFSIFAGIDRTTAILRGGGFDLTFEEKTTYRLKKRTPPLSYSGDTPAASRLLDGTTLDLNAMTRRGRARHAMERIDLDGEMLRKAEPITLFLVAQGEVEFDAGTQAARLGPLDACVVPALDCLKLVPASRATVYAIRFTL